MEGAYSLIVAPDHVDCLDGQIGVPGEPNGVVVWNGRPLRLVHEQRRRDENVIWFIYGDTRLSKPETLSRAEQWADFTLHPYRPQLRT